MPELRKDPILGRWIIISKERRKRPTDFIVEEVRGTGGFCPLCPGNESTTPSEVLAYRYDQRHEKNSSNWLLRVVPNKYPALVIEGDLDKEAEGLYDRMNGIGAHEVIIETPDHEKGLADLTVAEIADVLIAYRARFIDLRQDPRFRYLVLFKNHGRRAGAPIS